MASSSGLGKEVVCSKGAACSSNISAEYSWSAMFFFRLGQQQQPTTLSSVYWWKHYGCFIWILGLKTQGPNNEGVERSNIPTILWNNFIEICSIWLGCFVIEDHWPKGKGIRDRLSYNNSTRVWICSNDSIALGPCRSDKSDRFRWCDRGNSSWAGRTKFPVSHSRENCGMISDETHNKCIINSKISNTCKSWRMKWVVSACFRMDVEISCMVPQWPKVKFLMLNWQH